jgi:hypothetical protein
LSGGAEERRVTAKERYLREAYGAIRRKEERSKATRLELREIPSRRGDDALMVDQGGAFPIDLNTRTEIMDYWLDFLYFFPVALLI